MYPIEIQNLLNRLAYKYAPKFRASLMDAFMDSKHVASGDLARSVKVRVVEATDSESPKILIEYEDYGEFIGARKLIYTKNPPADIIAKWIEQKGSNFKRKALPGYSSTAGSNISIQKQNERIAYAISVKIRERGRLKSRYLWKRKALPQNLSDMNAELFIEWANETEIILSNALIGKSPT